MNKRANHKRMLFKIEVNSFAGTLVTDALRSLSYKICICYSSDSNYPTTC